MSVNTGLIKIENASKDLRARWNRTISIWDDENCRKFEENQLRPLMSRLDKAVEALGRMDVVVNQVKRDCK